MLQGAEFGPLAGNCGMVCGVFCCKAKVEVSSSYSSTALWCCRDLQLQSTSGVPWPKGDPNSE